MGEFKYVLFGLMVVIGVPVMAYLALQGAQARSWLLSLMIVSTGVGKNTSINFVSMESYRGPDRGFEVQLTDLICLSLAIGLIIRDAKRVQWIPFGTFVLALYLGMCLLSLAGAEGRLYGAFSIWMLLRALVIYWTVANLIRTGTPLEGAWRGFFIEGVVMTLTTLFQKYVQGFYRVPGPFDHSNTIPLYVNLFMPALVMWGLCDRSASRLKTLATLTVSLGLLASVAFTFSRAGTVLALVALLAAVAGANLTAKSTRTTIVSVVVALGLLAGVLRALPSFIERMENAPESSEEARKEFNIAAQLMARDHALGVGLNNFSLVLSYDERYRGHFVVMANEEEAGVCHHIYHLTQAELGKVGLAVFVLMMARFTLYTLVLAFRSRELESQLCWGFFLGLCCLHASGFLEWCSRLTYVTDMQMFVFGLVVGLGDRLRQKGVMK